MTAVLAVALAAYGLRWEAPAQCGSRESFERAVARRVLDPQRGGPGEVEAAVRVAETSEGFVLDLLVESSSGSSSTHTTHRQCQPLVQLAAVKLALALSPRSPPTATAAPPPAATSAPPPTATAAPPPTATATPRPDPAARRARPRRDLHRASVAAAVALDWGTLPGYGAALGLRAAHVGWGAIELGGAVGYLPGRKFWLVDQPSAGATLSMISGEVFVCAPLRTRRFEARVCPVAEVGAVRAAPYGLAPRHIRWAPRPALRVRGAAAWLPHPRVAVSLEASAGAPLLRYRFGVRDVGAVYVARPFSLRAGLALAGRI